MKKRNLKFCLVLLAALTLLLPSMVYAQNKTTKAQVEFVEGQGPTYPVDPEKPEIDVEIEPPIQGSLVIVDVTDFFFGSIPLTTRKTLHDIETPRPNIQVVDLRGTGVGWSVTAELTEFKSDSISSLPGAVLHIYTGRSNSMSSSPPPIPTNNLKLSADGEPKLVVKAPDGAGLGLWVMRWYPENPNIEPVYIQLEVPVGVATKGTHMATIHWTLENTPR